MARTGSSSKFVPANLNSSYGKPHPLSNGSSTGLGRSRSFGSSSYGGMVSLSRPSRVVSSSSATAPASARASKLTVPRPVNLPSLRREHSGNDPTVALVGSSGSPGWTKQAVEDAIDTGATRSDGSKVDSSSWGNNIVSHGKSPSGLDYSHQRAQGRSTVGHALPVVEKAVVFRGEDFPTLQTAAVPCSPSRPLQHPSRGLQQKEENETLNEPRSTQKSLNHQNAGDDLLYSKISFEHHIQPAAHSGMPVRGSLSDQADSGSTEQSGGYSRGPSPFIRLTHTSNWIDDERETLPSVQVQDRVQSDWSEPSHNWPVSHNVDNDYRRPSSRKSFLGRNDGDSNSVVFSKEGGPHPGGRSEHDHRLESDRGRSTIGRNEILKRGRSFSAAESNARFGNSSYATDRERDTNGRIFCREGRDFRLETTGQVGFAPDIRPRQNICNVGQGKDSKFGREVFLGKQGFPGSGLVSPSTHSGRGHGILYGGSELPCKPHIMRQDMAQVEFKRERKGVALYGLSHHADPFLGDGISSSLYVSLPLDGKGSRMTKNTLKDDLRDPARESFEAELERVEKMLEQERQRVAEERERALELVRKEQEEQERVVRKEEELRLKLEEESREAAYRVKREAEEAARKAEAVRRAREEEKRVAAMEEERRKEAARRKLLELEERIAKRASLERPDDDAEKVPAPTSSVDEVSTQSYHIWRSNNEVSEDMYGNSRPSSGKVERGYGDKGGSTSTRFPVDDTGALRPAPMSKGERGFSTWKRETPDHGPHVRSLEKGKMRCLQDIRPQQEPEYQERGFSLRNLNFRSHKDPGLGDMREEAPFENLDDADERKWWGMDAPGQSQYTSMGRLRQSLPRQPRVLPPPPGQAVTRKHSAQPDEPTHGVSSSSNGHLEADPPSREDLGHTIGGELIGAHDTGGEESMSTVVQVSQQFDSAPSEEVVLSDAGSQFSDETLEDEEAPTMQTYPDQELHSDIVSETSSEEEVNEMFDMIEAQVSSEDNEPSSSHVLEGEERLEKMEEGIKQEEEEDFGVRDSQVERGPEVVNCEGKLEEEKDEEEGRGLGRERNGSEKHESGCLIKDVGGAKDDVGANRDPAPEEDSVYIEGEPCAEPAVEMAFEKGIQEQEMHHHHLLRSAPVISISTGDTGWVRHMEGVSSRQSLAQHFQQPFSFMAMPLPQSGTLNHVVAAPAMLPSVHGLSNQQELSFHLQLGLLPSMPLMPNAIQIGSIQMPLHVHPQLPQLAHLHGQQATVFQFGQIGHVLPVSQPSPPTQAALQLHHFSGQSLPSQQQQQQPDLISIADSGHATMDSSQQSTVGKVVCVEDVMVNPKVVVDKGVEAPAVLVAKLETSADWASQKHLGEDKFGASVPGNRGHTDYNAQPSNKSTRNHRMSKVSRYVSGTSGRGRGRFDTGQQYSNQAGRNWAETSARGVARGKGFRRTSRRAEYRVREPVQLESAADDMSPALHPAMEQSKGYMYVKKGTGGQLTAVGENNGQIVGARSHATPNAGKADQPSGRDEQPQPIQLQPSSKKEQLPISGRGHQPTKQATATSSTFSRAKGLLRKYEADTSEDRTGVVRVFEQPGIETRNDKDDFIKVRSKRQLLKELREQREKESNIALFDMVIREQSAKKLPRSSAKAGSAGGLSGASISKSSLRRRPHTTERSATDGQNSNTNSSIRGPGGSVDAYNRTRNLRKLGQSTSASKDVIMESEDLTHGKHFREHSMTTSAWGGQRSNQEVVSLTQIQLEEAMKKPSGLDVHFPESLHVPEKAMVILEEGSSSSPSAVEKTVASMKASSPLSSLLAGEKIQFGAVTSPTVLPSSICPPSPMPVVQTGSPLGFRADLSHMTSHSMSYAGNYPDCHIAPRFTSKMGDSACGGDGSEGVVVDLEAEAEAAASAVAAAAISSDESSESHSNTRGSTDVSSRSSGLLETTSRSLQSQNISSLESPIGVALPADLSVETPLSLFQGSSVTLPDSPGVVLRSIQGGAPAYSGGPLLGGPVFSFGPRDDGLSSMAMEPGLPNWQQRRHVGTPDSFYDAPPAFLNPVGHPHMLVYANPFTPMGQFGQLGVSFMGAAAYHPSGKQPDWTHVPLPSSSGVLASSDGNLSAGTSGMTSSTQHSSGILTQRMHVPGSPVLQITAPSSIFDGGLAAPFQSDWLQAPAPPGHSAPNSGLMPPMQSMPSLRSAVEVNMQGHTSRVFANQPGHLPHVIGVNDGGFQQQLSGASSSLLSEDVRAAQLPDELGLPEAMPTVSGLLNEAGRMPLSETGLKNSVGSAGPAPAPMLHRSWSSLGHNNRGELMCGADSESPEKRRGQASMDSHSKAVGPTSSSPCTEQRASKQALTNGAEWSRSSQRKAASGRVSSMDNRGGSVMNSKLKQIYVAKATTDSRKLGAACI